MDELLSMIDELKSNGISIDEVQLQKLIEAYRYMEKVAEEQGGIVTRPDYSLEGCGFEFKCDYYSPVSDKKVIADLLRCCSEITIEAMPNDVFSVRFFIPDVFRKETLQ